MCEDDVDVRAVENGAATAEIGAGEDALCADECVSATVAESAKCRAAAMG